ncbi:peptide/nickel transport system ATP-binding protein/oligopeptide transport system ATP-binding protein [Halanaerobium saccharolyticum]|uniref:Peptide/nickel transport system ATP-binding protein/oligopeptide transport system ATP-binding protein n=1 Tax=Halanaerobium saccharolyticum TaxID=43595 RepID=A0A4R7YUQ3_9FIRM|nr:oligopeptide/dipeptide ABC transporter ATP-binding protein [Halanaerobium saccharolyticum]RAK06884.1 peptide/nickel transport system ATP-binding protein/oligopeptide transport system ATP-binding protein [Halanaerobium saccharolyticum]TDW01494.1 peptide/nickel transport system ATP-binding protein/oligopeptide transport system ATP-binding protein [Halanaerobium saccharolyticum]TDX52855.1 peptide/nickel transport system ATP-binding protein/oligopeptide transport system ATP-binding protein [Halan
MTGEEKILEVNDLKKYFPIRKGFFKRVVGHVKAVDGVDFTIKKGETLGLVGESGCGKSTLARTVLKLLEPTAGNVIYNDQGIKKDLAETEGKELRKLRRNIQMIFQDPFSSLDSRLSVRDIVAEPLTVQGIGKNRKERTEKVKELLEQVGLNSYQMNRYPHEFSGGQRQRIGVARALALNPELIICDEPVSALDVSVQAQVLNLLSDLQKELGLTYLFIAHDLGVVEYISDRIMVMYLGKIVEVSDADDLYESPKHPYTEALLKSIAAGDPFSDKPREALEGTVPDPANPPSGCKFHTRCPYCSDLCKTKEPDLIPTLDDYDSYVACHFSDSLDLKSFEK